MSVSLVVGMAMIAASDPSMAPAVPDPSGASAPDAGIELRWAAPPTCPTADEVREAIDRMHPATPSTPLVVDADVHGIDGGFELALVVSIDGGSSERRLQAADCGDLARATALVAATMIDPITIARRVVDLEPDVPTAIPEPEPEPPLEFVDVPASISTAEAPTPRADPRPDPRPPLRPVASLRLESLVGIAALPRLDAGLSATAGVVLGRVRLEVGAAHLFAQTREHPREQGVAMRVRATVAIARGCFVPRIDRWEFPLCGGAEVGVMSGLAQGDAVQNAARVRSPYAAGLVEAHAAWRITPRFALWIGLQGAISIARPRFTVAALEPFVQTPAGGGRAKLGVEVRFP